MKQIIIFYLLFAIFFELSSDVLGRTINLMFFHEGIKIIPTVKQNPLRNLDTYNTYIHPRFARDSRFINRHSWEGGVDTSRKLIQMIGDSELVFRLSIPVDHRIVYEFQAKDPPIIQWNGKEIDTKTVLIGDGKNTLKIKVKSDTIIKKLVLEPTFRAQEKRHFLFTVIDSLRGDVPGFNESSYGVTPQMDEIAKTSVVLQKHLVNSAWTRPSTLIFLTGKYPSKVFINIWDYPVFPSEKESFYQSGIVPLPAYLSALGYKTVMVGNNPFLTDHRYLGVDVGFEEVHDLSFVNEDTLKITKRLFSLLEEWRAETRPLFIFLNYNDPHKPYEPPIEFLSKVKTGYTDMRKKNYLGEVAFVDHEIGKVVERFKEEKLWDDTFFLLTSDHGEVMDPVHARSKFTGVYTLYGHGQGLYEEDVHTPLLIRYPKQMYQKKIKSVTRSIDLMPTVLDVLNIPFDEKEFDGKSLIPVWEGFETGDRLYYGETRGVRGVRIGGWKYMKKTFDFHRLGVAWDGTMGPEPEYLYNYELDPREEKTFQDPERVEILKQYFSLGNQEKNLYCIRLNSFEGDSYRIRADVFTSPGKVVLSDRKYQPIQDEDVKEAYKGFRLEKSLQGKFQKDYCFYSYPDISIPKVYIYVNGTPVQKGQLGVGGRDVYPDNCPMYRDSCLPLYISAHRDPEPAKKFRIQVWGLTQKSKVRTEKVILEKEALDILRKQGYIQ